MKTPPPAPPGFWQLLGFHIERADEQGAVLAMEVPDAMMSPFGTVHGGVLDVEPEELPESRRRERRRAHR